MFEIFGHRGFHPLWHRIFQPTTYESSNISDSSRDSHVLASSSTLNSSFYKYQLIIAIITTTTGILLNGISFSIFSRMEAKFRSVYHTLSMAVVAVDFLFVTIISVENIISVSQGTYLGVKSKAMCDFDSILGTSCLSCSVCLIACIAHVIKLNICHQYDISNRQSFILAFVVATICLLISLAILALSKGATVTRSGTFCLARSTMPSVTLLVLFALTAMSWLFYSFYCINKKINQSQRLLDLARETGRAKLQYFQNVKKLRYLLVGVAVCSLPLMLILAFQKLFVSWNASPMLMFMAGLLLLQYASITNPVIFITSDPLLRELFLDLIHRQIKVVMSIFPQRENKIVSCPESFSDYLHMQTWLGDEGIHHDLLKSYCKSIYADENILFLDDVKRYHQLAADFSKAFQDQNIAEHQVIEIWNDLNTAANRIIYLYIQASY